MLGCRGKKSREVQRVAKGARADGLKDTGEGWIKLESLVAVEIPVADGFDIFGKVAEKENVPLANLTRDLDLWFLVRARKTRLRGGAPEGKNVH